MALIDKLTGKPTIQKNIQENLDIQEITIILNMIKESSFQGKDLEKIYNLVVKLQNLYTEIEYKNSK